MAASVLTKKQRFRGSGMAKRQPLNVSLSCGNRETGGMGIVRFVACSRPFCSFFTAFPPAKDGLLECKRPSFGCKKAVNTGCKDGLLTAKRRSFRCLGAANVAHYGHQAAQHPEHLEVTLAHFYRPYSSPWTLYFGILPLWNAKENHIASVSADL